MTQAPGAPSPGDDLSSLRVPRALRGHVAEIAALIDAVCAEHLDDEYGALCLQLLAKLARKRPSPLVRGERRVWAAGALYTVGSINFLFDPSQKPHLRADELAALTGVAKSTMANKAALIRRTLRLGPLEPELCRRDLLARHPYAWLVEIDGLIVDVRALPQPLQDDARRRGLVPSWPGPASSD
ncbi:MAG: DUF6398 domain-containing protein [Acidimicrobiales bacterium]